MKKIMVILSITIICYVAYKIFLERTPERIIRWNINVCLNNFDYKVETFEDQWSIFGGNGYTNIIIKFNELTQENIDYFKTFNFTPLYLLKHTHIGIPYKYIVSDDGGYKYEVDDYINKIFIIDLKNNTAIYYCSVQ